MESLTITVIILYLVFTYIDYLQTRVIVESPRFYETNPVLGRSPSKRKTRTYFIAVVGASLGFGLLLPGPYRLAYFAFSAGWEFGFILHNHFLGVRI